jgi:hypothetical protein
MAIFDSSTSLTHPWSMAVRRVFAVLLIAAACATDPTLCAGWSNSAADRMACCKRGGGCTSVSADDCCANGEQRQNIEGAFAVVIPAPLLASGFLPISSSVRQPLDSESSSLADRPDTYLLDSVFRI